MVVMFAGLSKIGILFSCIRMKLYNTQHDMIMSICSFLLTWGILSFKTFQVFFNTPNILSMRLERLGAGLSRLE